MKLNSGIALATAAMAIFSGCSQPRVARAPVPPPPPPASATRNQLPQTGRQPAAGTTAAPVQKRRKMRRAAAEKAAAETNAAAKAPITPPATPAAPSPTTPATPPATAPAPPPAAPTSASDREISTGTDVEMRHDLQTTSQLLDSTLSRVNSLRKPLSAEEQQQVAQIRNYVKQSRAAAGQGDMERARNLALKGHLLADELSRRH